MNPDPIFNTEQEHDRKNGNHQGFAEGSGEKGGGEGFSPHMSTKPQGSLLFPQPLGETAFCGLAGSVVKAIAPYTEADPAALLGSLLTMFGSAVGRGPHFLAGDAEHPTQLYVCIVGETSIGRKGTSAEAPRRLLTSSDPTWTGRIASGLVSGEGVIHHVRDPRFTRRKPKKGEVPDVDGLVEELVDAGVEDKRLMVLVPEMAQVLGVISRKDNTLSAVIRDFWDRGTAQTLAKTSPDRATGALVSILAHITPTELRDRLESTEIANGFANRFLYLAARRSQLLPRGGSIPPTVLMGIVPSLMQALQHARILAEVDLTDDAWMLWDQHYQSLTTRPAGLVGAVTGRAAPMVRRLALIYALMDERADVHKDHLLAALEVWRYAEESAKWVFGDRLGQRLADHCLALLREAGAQGITRNELREALGHRIAGGRITDALQLLEDAGLAHNESISTGGRPTDRWYCGPAKEAKG